MDSKAKTFIIILLALLTVTLQVQSKAISDSSFDMQLIQNEISFLQNDIASDSLLVGEYLQQASVDLSSLDEKKQELDEECDHHKYQTNRLIEEGIISDELSVDEYYLARNSHAELEALKDELIVNHDSNIKKQYDETFEIVSSFLNSKKESLNSESSSLNEKNDKNSLFTLSATLVIGLIAAVGLVPKRKKKLLSSKEQAALDVIKKNEARSRCTTITDIKKACSITHPTAQTLIRGLEKKDVLTIKQSGREKHLFLGKF